MNTMNSPSGLSKRRPGRPPKRRSDSGLAIQQDQMPNVQPNDAVVSPNQPQLQHQGNSAGVSEPLSPSPKLSNDNVAAPSPPPTENSAAKRGRGRPPKVAAARGHATVSGGAETQGVETRSENPASNREMMLGMVRSNGGRVKKGRGRPRKIGIQPVTVPLSGNSLRPRGRPKRAGRLTVAGNGGAGGSGLSSTSGQPSAVDIAKLIGKTVGRRNKVGGGTACIVTDPRQLVVYQELKTKYELLQSKVKQVASAIKPILGDGNPALEMIQEVEALAGNI